MHTILYEFKVKPGQEKEFISTWAKVTQLFIKHCNGLGSRLHLVKENTYIAYAQWPDKATRNKASLPIDAQNLRTEMRTTCDSITILYEMDVVNDLLL